MVHWVLPTFKLVYRHLNGIFLTVNFAWAFSRTFVNSDQKDWVKFPNFDHCTGCGRNGWFSKGGYLSAFWDTSLSTVLLAWPKKQVNKPLLKTGHFYPTPCSGQNLEILPCPFGHCLQTVWKRPMQNCRSKRCRLGDPIPIWMWPKLSESYGM